MRHGYVTNKYPSAKKERTKGAENGVRSDRGCADQTTNEAERPTPSGPIADGSRSLTGEEPLGATDSAACGEVPTFYLQLNKKNKGTELRRPSRAANYWGGDGAASQCPAE